MVTNKKAYNEVKKLVRLQVRKKIDNNSVWNKLTDQVYSSSRFKIYNQVEIPILHQIIEVKQSIQDRVRNILTTSTE